MIVQLVRLVGSARAHVFVLGPVAYATFYLVAHRQPHMWEVVSVVTIGGVCLRILADALLDFYLARHGGP